MNRLLDGETKANHEYTITPLHTITHIRKVVSKIIKKTKKLIIIL